MATFGPPSKHLSTKVLHPFLISMCVHIPCWVYPLGLTVLAILHDQKLWTFLFIVPRSRYLSQYLPQHFVLKRSMFPYQQGTTFHNHTQQTTLLRCYAEHCLVVYSPVCVCVRQRQTVAICFIINVQTSPASIWYVVVYQQDRDWIC
jgi:hypothetical protein